MKKDDFVHELWRRGWRTLDGEHEGAPGVYVGKTLDGPSWHVPDAGIAAVPDYDALMCGRDVTNFTRIVGYYSRIDNWNPSKMGELEDRHGGHYGVDYQEVMPLSVSNRGPGPAPGQLMRLEAFRRRIAGTPEGAQLDRDEIEACAFAGLDEGVAKCTGNACRVA